MTPRTQAIAFRLWAYAAPRGWDCTPLEAADAIGVPVRSVCSVIRWKGWSQRFRGQQVYRINITYRIGSVYNFEDILL